MASKSTAKSNRPVDLLFRASTAQPAPVLEPVEPAPIVQVSSVPASSPVEVTITFSNASSRPSYLPSRASGSRIARQSSLRLTGLPGSP